jgi:hypothetical protein
MTTFSDSLDNIIHNFISKVSSTYNLNSDELLSIWKGKSVEPSQSLSSKPQSSSSNELMKMTKGELITLCKSKGLKVSGSKNDLIARIDSTEVPAAAKKSVQTKLNLGTTIEQAAVTKKLIEKIPEILIKKNQFGNFEHFETSFLIDKNTKKVYGKQNPDGSVEPLCHDDINICNKFKFEYILPTNLEKKTNINDVQVDDLDEDEFEEVEEEEEVELEEEEEEDEVEDDVEEYYEE